MPQEKTKLLLRIALAMLVAVIFFFPVAGRISSPSFVRQWTEQLDSSRNTVLKLTASSAAASVAITALPSDIANPVAEELAEMSKWFLLVLCALYLEKFIIVISGAVVCKGLIPAACIIYASGVACHKEGVQSIGKRIFALSLALLLVVPASLSVSKMIETTYEGTIEQVIESAENSADQIHQSVGTSQQQDAEKSGLGKIIQNLQNAGDTIANGTTQLIDYFERLLSRFIESAAIMLVVSCIIPILVMVLFIWIVKALFNVDLYTQYKNMEKLLKERKEQDAVGGPEKTDETVQV